VYEQKHYPLRHREKKEQQERGKGNRDTDIDWSVEGASKQEFQTIGKKKEEGRRGDELARVMWSENYSEQETRNTIIPRTSLKKDEKGGRLRVSPCGPLRNL